MILDKVFYSLEEKEQPVERSVLVSAYENMQPLMLKKILSDFVTLQEKHPPYSCGVVNEFVYDVINAIDNCGLTLKQHERLTLWMAGLNEREISMILTPSCTRWVTSKSLVAACDKILNYLRKC